MKFSFNKFGITVNPVGAQITLSYQNRTLLGDVVGCYRNENTGCAMLKVRHFDGSQWPIDPAASVVEVLERDYA
jgi:hypothetical protein